MIHIPENLLNSITRAAEAAYPSECCGLLVGRQGEDGDIHISRVEPSPNVAEGDRKKSFMVDAKVHFDLIRGLRDGPDEIVGNYHSHPGAPANPSEHDRQSVYYPDHVWIIVAVDDGLAGEAAAYVFDREDGNFQKTGLTAH